MVEHQHLLCEKIIVCFIFSTLSDAVGDLKTKIGDIELLCTGDDFDVFQKSDAMCMTAQDLLAQECDHHPQVSDGGMLNFDDQSTLVSNIMAYGSIQTGIMLYRKSSTFGGNFLIW